MDKPLIIEQTFRDVDFRNTGLDLAEYEGCHFKNCSFSNLDLSGMAFPESEFNQCDLSNVKTNRTIFRDTRFVGSKLLGIHFENCDDFLFTVRFETCVLNFSSFYMRQLKKTGFVNCSLADVDFTGADLSYALFQDCDLSGARFENTILEHADLRTTVNYNIDPELNRIKKAKFSMSGLYGLLEKYDIYIS